MSFSAYILHMRPMSFFFVGAHYAVGYLFSGRFHPGEFLLGLLIWTVGMNGGTLAINSAFDKDEGNIGLLKNPPPLPAGILPFSLALLLGGLALSLFLSWPFVGLYVFCLILSVFYSVPPFRFKAKPGWDILTNMAGYGASTFLAGAYASSSMATPQALWASAGFFFLFGALYPTTQIYQYDIDLRNQDITFAVFLGPKRSLQAAMLLVLIAHASFAFVSLTIIPLVLLLTSLIVWTLLLVRWIVKFERINHERQMYVFLGCWILTEAIVLLSYFW